jgi:hypothetical protein
MALFGNAHSIDPAQAQQEYARLLGHGEQIHAAYLLIRDTILFTDRRLILVDKQGITGKKTGTTRSRTAASRTSRSRRPVTSTSTRS